MRTANTLVISKNNSVNYFYYHANCSYIGDFNFYSDNILPISFRLVLSLKEVSTPSLHCLNGCVPMTRHINFRYDLNMALCCIAQNLLVIFNCVESRSSRGWRRARSEEREQAFLLCKVMTTPASHLSHQNNNTHCLLDCMSVIVLNSHKLTYRLLL